MRKLLERVTKPIYSTFWQDSFPKLLVIENTMKVTLVFIHGIYLRMEKIIRAENNLRKKNFEENCANKYIFSRFPKNSISTSITRTSHTFSSPRPVPSSIDQASLLSLYRTMCVHKEFTYDECGCIETDKHICIHNLKEPSFSESCPRFRGIEKFKVSGSCETHTMHPRSEAGDGSDEAQHRAGHEVLGLLRRRCSCCMIM